MIMNHALNIFCYIGVLKHWVMNVICSGIEFIYLNQSSDLNHQKCATRSFGSDFRPSHNILLVIPAFAT